MNARLRGRGRRDGPGAAVRAARPWRVAGRRTLVQLACGVLLLAVIITGPDLYGRLTRGDRLDPALANVSGVVHVEVATEFEPQGFHLRTLQQHGVFGGKASETSVRLFNVRPAALDRLSRLYWVESIHPITRDR